MSLWPRGLQHTRLPCLSPSPGFCSDSCPSSWWCHPTISSSVALFSSCPQSFLATGSFPVTRLFASGGFSVRASASETQLQFLGQEDSLEEDMATHSSILAWKIPCTEEPGGLQFMGSQESHRTKWLSTAHLKQDRMRLACLRHQCDLCGPNRTRHNWEI